MEFLKEQRRFHFLYDGKPVEELPCSVEQQEEGNALTTVYTFAAGLKITNCAKKVGDAYEWVNWLENTGSEPTGIISELWDCEAVLPLPHEEPAVADPYCPELEDITAVYSYNGSVNSVDDLACFDDKQKNNRYVCRVTPGYGNTYSASGGRSCEDKAPFFHIRKNNVGYLCAIGWTGQWTCEAFRNTDDMVFRSGIAGVHFRLMPGEKLRTSSVVILPYEGSMVEGQNKWRRLVREYYSLLGAPGRDAVGPLCASIWGGMKTDAVLKRIETIKENQLPYDYLWMDAGWYGIDTEPTASEFGGNWSLHTGDWRVSPLVHPKGLKPVADAAHKAGMKFLLWFEPERVRHKVPIVQQHPEYFLDIGEENLLLDLGDEAAWNYCFEMLCRMIEEIGIDCYRQDFNMPVLEYWKKKDTEDRQGIAEIRYIMGLYRLWDALLEKFPHLLIDNCASGGRRIDIETLRRSIPLWRSDYQCLANYPPEGSQCHTMNYGRWLPFSGTGCGRLYDTYGIRSAYSPAMSSGYTFSEREDFGDGPQQLLWLKDRLEEYRKVRPYLSEDFYPLTQPSDRTDIWAAMQYHNPKQDEGVVLVYRRDFAPYETAKFQLYGLNAACDYTFTEADRGETAAYSGAELLESGLPVSVKEKRTAKIYFYKKKC